jgi:hypothetical protein
MNSNNAEIGKTAGIISIVLYLIPVLIFFLVRFISFLWHIPYFVWMILHWLQLVTAVGAIILGMITILNKEENHNVATIAVTLGGIGLLAWLLSQFWHIGLTSLLYLIF